MSLPVLYGFYSPDLDRGGLPPDRESCAVPVSAEIGPAGGGSETFSFMVVTPDRVLAGDGVRWGRGLLVVDRFSWEAVEGALTKLLMFADRPSWKESAQQLAKEMHWEFDGYRTQPRR